MSGSARDRANARYRRRTMAVVVRVNPRTERPVYDRLLAAENKAGYIKGLVMEDVERERRPEG